MTDFERAIQAIEHGLLRDPQQKTPGKENGAEPAHDIL